MTTMPPAASTALLGRGTCLYVSGTDEHASWLGAALAGSGLRVVAAPDPQAVDEHLGATPPRAVFLDFSGPLAERSAALATTLHRERPDLPLVAMGRSSQPSALLTALRAGVDDFIDLDDTPTQVLPALRELLARRDSARPPTKGRTVALLGARAGLGVSTLACNLAACMQALRHGGAPLPPAPHPGVALLDLGLPARDGLLYLGLQSNFSFVDGVHNLQRLDQTLLQTTLAQHACGAAVLPLPLSLGQIREISHAQSVTLVQRLADFFDLQIADLGGFSTVDFVAQMARASDTVWVVCDQSIGGIVSTAALLRELREREVDTGTLALVVNQFEAGTNPPAQDIASQLGLPLAHVLPARRAALLNAASKGQLIAHAARNDPYTQVVMAMARGLQSQGATRPSQPSASPATGTDSRWSRHMAQILHKWKSRG